MKAIVVYESYWGNTAAVARTIAEGLGPEAQRFIVKGKFGPLREGELDRARNWGSELAKAMG